MKKKVTVVLIICYLYFCQDIDGYPFLADSVVVGPGLSSLIKVKKQHSKILAQPYSECLDISSDTDTSSLPSQIQQIIAGLRRLNISYTRDHCTELLIQDETIKRLNCYDLRLINYRENVSPCTNVSVLADKDTQLVDNKNCPLECETTSYTLTISQDNFPSYQAYQASFLNKTQYIQDLFGIDASNFTYDVYQKSYTSINVYFEDLTVMDLSESISIDQVQLLSNLGGTIGIFLGVSVISAVECVELILVLIFITLKYIKFNRNRSG